jgi:hypothetical protein
MKPRIFIGSSKEALDIAYIIQENLEYDAQTTVWTQGIFQLSSNTLDDLLTALKKFDFGIFVFKPDDISQIRSNSFNTVRDNVIFELGLFIGKLGKNKVFFVIPNDTSNFHLPTDLLGVAPGTYDNNRDDKNYKAALGPFCNQIRAIIKNFVFENLIDLANEPDKVKQIAINKPPFWEFLFSGELLKARLVEINRSYNELDKGLIFKRSKKYNLAELVQWIGSSMTDFQRIIEIFKKTFEVELINAYGAPGVAGNIFEIKFCIDKIISICKELLAWEYDLQGIIAPEEMKEIVQLLKGWSKFLINEINKFPGLIEQSFIPENITEDGTINISLKLPSPPGVDRISEILEEVTEKIRNSY